MPRYFTPLDWTILVAYFVAIMGVGMYFRRQNKSSDDFTAGGRSLSGWLCGLSIFATYLSSISYLALPGSSFVGNWNSFVMSLTLPITAWIAQVWFLPYYRRTQEVSAYAMLEHRFGPWARVFSSTFYLLFQIARMGVVMYLMALPMAVIFGWDIRGIILITGIVVTVYAMIGGILAVIWADAVQAVVLMVGAAAALVVILLNTPGGVGGVLEVASASDKFSLGDPNITHLAEKTIWVVFFFGVMENIKNFGIDQSYIQRYIAARSDSEARRAIWLGGILYIPISALFFFIGSSLYAFYQADSARIDEVKSIVAKQKLMQAGQPPVFIKNDDGELVWEANYESQLRERADSLELKHIGDRVFPHFIAAYLPAGVTGLLIAAIFAAAMSTVSTSLNSSATLVMSDYYRRFVRPDASDKTLLRCLHGSTILWGLFGTAMALTLVPLTESVLDIWWKLSSVLGAGIVGLFLLGMISRRPNARDAQTAVAVGMLIIGWMVVSRTEYWPEAWRSYASPFHEWWVIVVGTIVILAVGLTLSLRHASDPHLTREST